MRRSDLGVSVRLKNTDDEEWGFVFSFFGDVGVETWDLVQGVKGSRTITKNIWNEKQWKSRKLAPDGASLRDHGSSRVRILLVPFIRLNHFPCTPPLS